MRASRWTPSCPETDSIAADDSAPVAAEGTALAIGVIADPSTATVLTGGATVLEQALSALGTDQSVRPLTVLPDDRGQLDPLAALFIDDPGGIPAEARSALGEWVSRGGVAVALLGPRAESAQLGSSLEPFVRGAVRWEQTKAKGAVPKSVAWLGAPGESLEDLGGQGTRSVGGHRATGFRGGGALGRRQAADARGALGARVGPHRRAARQRRSQRLRA